MLAGPTTSGLFAGKSVEINRGNDYRRAVRQTFGGPLPRHEVLFRIQRVIYDFTIQSSDTGRPTPFIVVVKDTDANDDARQTLQDARGESKPSLSECNTQNWSAG